MSEGTKPLIWWTSQADCEKIGNEPRPEWPEYLKRQYASRLGRAGRCRLWVDDEIEKMFGEVNIDWPSTPRGVKMTADLLSRACYGGIVIHPEDVIHILKLPGIITDTNLRTDEEGLVIL